MTFLISGIPIGLCRADRKSPGVGLKPRSKSVVLRSEGNNTRTDGGSSRRLQRLSIEERPFAVALPEVCKDYHARDRRIRTPQRSEGVAFELHHDQENCKVSRTENNH